MYVTFAPSIANGSKEAAMQRIKYRNLVIFRTLLFHAVLISYAPDIIYETRVKVSLLKIFVRLIFVRTAAYEIK